LTLDVSAVPSPCYVVDEAALQANLATLSRVQQEADCRIILALKGFAMWSLFPLLRQHLAGCTASSLWELTLANETFGGERHIYSTAYRADEFASIAAQADHVVFNTVAQWQRFGAQARLAGASCGLRVNPVVSEVATALYNPCASGSRFGVRVEDLADADVSGLEGFHVHALCENMHDASIRLIDAFEARFGAFIPQLQWVNFGGGHLMTHANYDVDALIERVRRFRKRWGVQVYFEPGGAVAWRTGVLIASVLDVVKTDALPVAILDVSATAHMPDVLEMPYRPTITDAAEAGALPYSYRLGGVSCLAGDVMGDYSFSQPLTVGSRLVFEDMIHYTMVKTTMFNGVRHPDIGVWRDDQGFKLVRRFTYDDFKQRLS